MVTSHTMNDLQHCLSHSLSIANEMVSILPASKGKLRRHQCWLFSKTQGKKWFTPLPAAARLPRGEIIATLNLASLSLFALFFILITIKYGLATSTLAMPLIVGQRQTRRHKLDVILNLWLTNPTTLINWWFGAVGTGRDWYPRQPPTIASCYTWDPIVPTSFSILSTINSLLIDLNSSFSERLSTDSLTPITNFRGYHLRLQLSA